MRSSQSLPEYGEIAEDLERLPNQIHPSEFHGALSGYLCIESVPSYDGWNAILRQLEAGGSTPVDSIAFRSPNPALYRLYEVTMAQLEDEEFGFQLLLPEEETSVIERTEALAAWCQGFLFGVSATNANEQKNFSSDVEEIFRDFVQVSQAGVDTETDNDANESALSEVTEYIRVGVMLIRTECALANQASKGALH